MKAGRTRRLIDPAEIGKKGGLQRARNMTPEERSESARAASRARWARKKKAKS